MVSDLVDKVTFWRPKVKHPYFAFSYHCWWFNPLACLCIGM